MGGRIFLGFDFSSKQGEGYFELSKWHSNKLLPAIPTFRGCAQLVYCAKMAGFEISGSNLIDSMKKINTDYQKFNHHSETTFRKKS